jgi:hypothetical protein
MVFAEIPERNMEEILRALPKNINTVAIPHIIEFFRVWQHAVSF